MLRRSCLIISSVSADERQPRRRAFRCGADRLCVGDDGRREQRGAAHGRMVAVVAGYPVSCWLRARCLVDPERRTSWTMNAVCTSWVWTLYINSACNRNRLRCLVRAL
jgi:hypothetical protein